MTNFIVSDQTDNNVPDNDSGIYQAVTITSSHFGSNALLNDSLLRDDPSHGASDVEYLNVSTLRYPGGTVTEELFDLTNPELERGQEDAGGTTRIIPISGFLDFASEADSKVNIVIPTRDGLSLSAAQALISGEYGNRIPTSTYLQNIADFVRDTIKKANDRGVEVESFEIGNEFWLGGRMTAAEYGRLAGEVALVIEEVLFDSGYSRFEQPNILLQSVSNAGKFSPRNASEQTFYESGQKYTIHIPGQGSAGSQLDDIKAEIGNILGAADAIDGIVDHYYDKKGFYAVDDSGQYIFEQFDELASWLEDIRTPGFPPISRYVTEWNVKRSGGNEPQGLQGASINIEMFYEMVTHGIDSAQFWPLVGGDNDLSGGDEDISINGVAFRLMSGSLLGLNPEFDFENSQIDVHGFRNGERHVLLVSERSGNEQTNINMDLRDVLDSGQYFITVTELSDGQAGGADANAAPELTYTDGFISNNNIIALDLEAWSIARIEITYMNEFSNLIQGRDGNDTIVGGAGDDTIIGGSGDDNLYGQTNNDLIFGGNGEDSINGGGGRDMIFGDTGNDTLKGGLENDTLEGGHGNDFLFGGDGNDIFLSGFGSDFIDGGSGSDTLSFENALMEVNIWTFDQVVEIESSVIEFQNVEVLIATHFSDRIVVSDDDYQIYTLEGDDVAQVIYGSNTEINLGEGDDFSYVYFGNQNSIKGGGGDDELYNLGGQGNYFEGNLGNDEFHLLGGDGRILKYNLGDGEDTVFGFNLLTDEIIVVGISLESGMEIDLNPEGTTVSFYNGDAINFIGLFDENIIDAFDFF